MQAQQSHAMLYFLEKGVINLDYQKITASLIGNATHDAQVKLAHDSGNRYGDFRLAVRNRDNEANYFPVRCFGKLVEGLKGIKKGTKVFIDGELEISSFDGEDGNKRMTFRVVANTYRILANGRNGSLVPTVARQERSHAGSA
ncbi:MAG: single-stranded DNA-binding protein [Caldilineaceae bacterium]|nr:single-stranded DNA-binding protein [Caldilineaceae bacterium]